FHELNLPNLITTRRPEFHREAIQDVACRWQQLMRLPHVTDLVRPFAEKADPTGPDVQPRAHAIAFFRRRHNTEWSRRLEVGHSLERVRDDRRFEFPLMIVGHVGVETAATQWICGDFTA